MKRGIFCFNTIIIAFVVVILWRNANVIAADFISLDLIKNKAKELFSSIDIRSYKLENEIYDEQKKLIMIEDVFVVLPDKVKSRITDYQNHEFYIYIINGNKHWFNKPCLPVGVFISQLFLILADKSIMGEILTEESRLAELNGKKCFIISFLFNGIKIRGYLDYSSLSWIKIEGFFSTQERFVKVMEMYPQEASSIDNLMIPMLASGNASFSSGMKNVELHNLFLEKNLPIEDSNFDILQ